MKNTEFRVSNKTVWFLIIGTIIFTIAGSFAQVQHYKFSDQIFTLALTLFLSGWVIIISDISKSKIYNKPFWIMSMIILPAIAPFIYLIRRNSLIQNSINFN